MHNIMYKTAFLLHKTKSILKLNTQLSKLYKLQLKC